MSTNLTEYEQKLRTEITELEGKNKELVTAIHRLPKPPDTYGDGPDERVMWAIQCRVDDVAEQARRIDKLEVSRQSWIDNTCDVNHQLAASEERVRELEGLLRTWLSMNDEPCSLDHHGACQVHYGDMPCIVPRTVKALSPTTGEKEE